MNPCRRHLLNAVVVFTLCAPLTTASMAAGVQQPDNSAQNKTQTKTADNQPDAKADRLTTANVRKAIIADKSLSVYAHNIKIITNHGTVTLKGPVRSDDEKQKVMTDAASVVSQDKVTNQITVKQ